MRRILVVDDEQAIRGLLRDMLEPVGYEVVEAANGAEGLRRYHAVPPDLVMTDIEMPVMDGLALMLALRRACPWVKLLAMSGSGNTLQKARPLTPYTLEKPFTLAAVQATVQRAFREGTGEKAP